MSATTRRRWYYEATRARARFVLDMAQASLVPHLTEEARAKFFESIEESMHLYAGEQSEHRRAQQAKWKASRERARQRFKERRGR